MIISLFWKEYREHRSIWIAMALLAIVTLTGAVQLLLPQGWKGGSEDAVMTVAGGALILTAMYGLVCGAMMFAGERESNGMAFLAILPIDRVALWWTKCLIGMVFALLYCLVVVGIGLALGVVGPGGIPLRWTMLLPMIVLETYAWSLFASSFCRTVLTAVAMAALLPLPLIGLCSGILAVGTSHGMPMLLLLVINVVMTVLPLILSLVIFSGRQLEDRFVIKPSTSTYGAVAPKRQPSRLAVLFWLVLRQGSVLAGSMCFLGFAFGLALPTGGAVLWPFMTLLLGVLCGTAVFMGEQNEGAFKFWGDQRLPVGWLWLGRTAIWAGLGLFVCLLMLLGALIHAGSGTSLPSDPALLLQTLLGMTETPINAGSLWAMVLMWPMYGFAYGQICSLIWRKSAVAVVVAVMGATGTAAIWLPSLMGGGVSLVQVLGLPLLVLLGCRLVLWDWVTGRLKTRPAVVRLVGATALGYAWVSAGFAYRVVEVPGGGEPFNRAELQTHLSNPEEGRAGQAIQNAVSKAEDLERPAQPNLAPKPTHRIEMLKVIEQGWPAEPPVWDRWLKEMTSEPWPTELAAAGEMPLGVYINPRDLTQGPAKAASCRRAAELLTARALQIQARGNDSAALDQLTTVLALSRHLRHWAPAFSHLEGVEIERLALTGFGQWLEHVNRPFLLRRALARLRDHETATPPVTDALASEFLRFREGLGKGIRGGNAEVEALLMQVPWEADRTGRLTDAIFAGRRRLAESGEMLPLADDGPLADWQPAADGPTRERLEHLYATSWLHGSLPPTAAVQRAALLSQCRIRAARLQTALALYQIEHGKPAATLDELVPALLPEVPLDPFTHRAFRYRVSSGEQLTWHRKTAAGGEEFVRQVPAGQGILWSAGPDGRDDGGTRQWDKDAREATSQDLIFLVPRGSR